ncbi:vascular cell adhesion protein 1-like isoform X2 [Syngnathoides biaculeatus]|uniref:vascular cell adhesion protein 1-like isoform X2 n=1 Tax=Syngnathoides biaculeatus TaxID=300417 RepID=UPI002ADDABA7|nr:vascular cell adhesion protein 1-like isoform X2 [Syngnathoides biaculeatus]
MFSCYIFLSVLSLSGFLGDFHVFGCDENCPDKPVFSPSRLVVEFGTSTSANCSVCREDCLGKFSGLEHSTGRFQKNETTYLWTAEKINTWTSSILCYYNKGKDLQCCSILPIIVYQFPTKVEVGFRNHDGPMLEGQQYQLYCRVEKVAPLRNVIVTLYQGETVLGQYHPKYNNENKPSNMTFMNVFNATKENDGARYKCVARLDLEHDVALNDTISNIVTATVYYKPQLVGPAGGPVSLTVGDPLHLNCSAEGNPRPSVTWILPSAAPSDFHGEVFSVDSVATEHKGQYVCSINNTVGTATVKFYVESTTRLLF